MQFNNYEFIFCFLPVVVLLYFLANHVNLVVGKIVLVVSSLFFYAFGRVEMLPPLLLSICFNYSFALIIGKARRKWILILSLFFNVCLLVYFKYTDFFIANINAVLRSNIRFLDIKLCIGISFYTFQQISYVVSIYRYDIKSVDLLDYLTYILYFPKILMGPITDPVLFIEQINQRELKRPDIGRIAIGINLFSLGLFKKAFIADRLSAAVWWVGVNADLATPTDYIIMALCYSFEIYFDFSGYSDMAVGISSLLNIDLPVNFDSPYKSISVRDFWRRWHISLTGFFTKYIYIPLGGSKKGKYATYRNTMMVFLISGLWHGASWSFVLWGFLHGFLCCFDRIIERIEKKVFKPIRRLITFVSVTILWMLFGMESITGWKNALLKIVNMRSLTISKGLIGAMIPIENNLVCRIPLFGHFVAVNSWIYMALLLIFSGYICFVPENNIRRKGDLGMAAVCLSALAFAIGVFSIGNESVFVYFGF